MNTKITYCWTREFDESMPNNGFEEETDYIVVGDGYGFEEFLSEHSGLDYEKTSDGCYQVVERHLDENHEEVMEYTGEAYLILKEEPTDEELCW